MSRPRLSSTAAVLAVRDVGAAARWYTDILGFEAHLFPDEPPYAFAILCRDGVELMLRRCQPPQRAENDWDVYVRMDGVDALHDELAGHVRVVEPLSNKPYHCREFTIEDPNGYRLVFSESTERGAPG